MNRRQFCGILALFPTINFLPNISKDPFEVKIKDWDDEYKHWNLDNEWAEKIIKEHGRYYHQCISEHKLDIYNWVFESVYLPKRYATKFCFCDERSKYHWYGDVKLVKQILIWPNNRKIDYYLCGTDQSTKLC